MTETLPNGTLFDLLAAIACLLGALLFLISAVGLVRLPDVYSRAHSPTKAATLGLMLLALGSALGQRDLSVAFEDLLMIAFVMLTLPVSAAVVLRAARSREQHDAAAPTTGGEGGSR